MICDKFNNLGFAPREDSDQALASALSDKPLYGLLWALAFYFWTVESLRLGRCQYSMDTKPKSLQCSFPTVPRHEKKCFFAYAKTKAQISCAVTVQLMSTFVFVT